MSFGTWSGDRREMGDEPTEPTQPFPAPRRSTGWREWRARFAVLLVRSVHMFAGSPRILTEYRAQSACERVGGGRHFRRSGQPCRVCGWEASR